ncbi:hypothetical protein XA68_18116 [Ophiocordyceps unilateralis]|uniref:Uncharacterized protein n=1 Tax=Ophiocordyceps unilateralis TaxID=268505 RepID=A0A2A9P3T6_OPHUN|nr:hypothetical protein XA68_18116 [Ophiocordyceps unilateralis]
MAYPSMRRPPRHHFDDDGDDDFFRSFDTHDDPFHGPSPRRHRSERRRRSDMDPDHFFGPRGGPRWEPEAAYDRRPMPDRRRRSPPPPMSMPSSERRRREHRPPSPRHHHRHSMPPPRGRESPPPEQFRGEERAPPRSHHPLVHRSRPAPSSPDPEAMVRGHDSSDVQPRRRHRRHHSRPSSEDDRPRRGHHHHHPPPTQAPAPPRAARAGSPEDSDRGSRRRHRAPSRGRSMARDGPPPPPAASNRSRGAEARPAAARRNSMPANIVKKGQQWWANPLIKAGARTAFSAGAQAAMQSRNDPSPWLGAKGAKVATAALGAAIVDGFMAEKHPGGVRHEALRQGRDAVLGEASRRSALNKSATAATGGGRSGRASRYD